jgi:para-nitrobenzyl esterase
MASTLQNFNDGNVGMLRVAIACLGAFGALLAFPAAATERLVTGGIVRGEDLADGGTIFRGIPYAAAPVGALRWKPPAPVEPWPGIRDATKPQAPCLQHDEGWNKDDAAKSGEDCLYLSIHAPVHKPTDRLPVMVWVHGGSNRAGAGYGFVDSALPNRGVVLVTIEYRLGIFGFLASPALSAESPNHASGNYAIMDQIAALRWVKDNIARFGGDPDNVTIAGQSAGAYNVGILLLSPLAHGLFAKAIAESGTPGIGLPPRMRADNEALGTDLAALAGVSADAQGLEKLRTMPGSALLAPGDELVPHGGLDPSAIWAQAMVDGFVLPRAPKDILDAREQARVPLIAGSNSREIVLDMPEETARAMIGHLFGDRAAKAQALYTGGDKVYGNLPTQALSDVIFRCPASLMAQWQQQATPKVWRYQFGLPVPDSGRTAEHSAELKYVFDALRSDIPWPPVQAYWANFLRRGDPNGRGLPHWPSLGARADYIDFTPEGSRIAKDLRGAICRLTER